MCPDFCAYSSLLHYTKHPTGTTLEVPDPDEGMENGERKYQIQLISHNGPVDIFLVNAPPAVSTEDHTAAAAGAVAPPVGGAAAGDVVGDAAAHHHHHHAAAAAGGGKGLAIDASVVGGGVHGVGLSHNQNGGGGAVAAHTPNSAAAQMYKMASPTGSLLGGGIGMGDPVFHFGMADEEGLTAMWLQEDA